MKTSEEEARAPSYSALSNYRYQRSNQDGDVATDGGVGTSNERGSEGGGGWSFSSMEYDGSNEVPRNGRDGRAISKRKRQEGETI